MKINIVRNFCRLFKIILHEDKIYILSALCYVLLSSIAPFINILYFKYLYDAITYHYEIEYIIKITLIMLGANLVVTNGIVLIKSKLTLRSKFLLLPLTAMFCKKSIDMDYAYTEDQEVIQEINRASFVLANGDNLEIYLDSINNTVITMAQIVIIFIITTMFNPLLIGVVFLTTALNTFISSRVQKKNYAIHRELLPVDRVWRYIIEIATQVKYAKTIRLYSMANFITKKSDENREQYSEMYEQVYKNETKGTVINNLVTTVQEVFIYLILVFAVLFKGLSIGNFSVLINVISQFSGSFNGFFGAILNIYVINNYINDFFGFIDRPSQLRLTSKNAVLDTKKPGKFEFRHVSFHYPNNSRLILDDVNLVIEPGECLVIVGENGAGKTTFVKLLMRLYEVTSGEILYNGVNIKDYDYDEYMSILSTVFQDYKMFSLSLYENITFKQFVDNDSVVADLLKETRLYDKVQLFPYKEKTNITKRFDCEGVELSGGQSQKLAMCRLMYKNSPIMILDEPSASLSPVAENEIYSQVANMIKNKTAIFISHRLSSSLISDHICVLDKGRVAEYGTHKELLQLEGIYKKMYDIQSQYYNSEVVK